MKIKAVKYTLHFYYKIIILILKYVRRKNKWWISKSVNNKAYTFFEPIRGRNWIGRDRLRKIKQKLQQTHQKIIE